MRSLAILAVLGLCASGALADFMDDFNDGTLAAGWYYRCALPDGKPDTDASGAEYTWEEDGGGMYVPTVGGTEATAHTCFGANQYGLPHGAMAVNLNDAFSGDITVETRWRLLDRGYTGSYSDLGVLIGTAWEQDNWDYYELSIFPTHLEIRSHSGTDRSTDHNGNWTKNGTEPDATLFGPQVLADTGWFTTTMTYASATGDVAATVIDPNGDTFTASVAGFVPAGLTGLNVGVGSQNDCPEFDYLGAVPEPATMALLALGAVALIRRRR